MDIELSLNDNSELAQEIKKCIIVILNTRAGTLAMDRDFGLTCDFLDMNTEQAKQVMTQEIITKLAKYEPRANVDRITFKADVNGVLKPKLEVSINYE